MHNNIKKNNFFNFFINQIKSKNFNVFYFNFKAFNSLDNSLNTVNNANLDDQLGFGHQNLKKLTTHTSDLSKVENEENADSTHFKLLTVLPQIKAPTHNQPQTQSNKTNHSKTFTLNPK